jgi:hypothetical protein
MTIGLLIMAGLWLVVKVVAAKEHIEGLTNG